MQLDELFEKYVSQAITEAEKQQFFELVREPEYAERLQELMDIHVVQVKTGRYMSDASAQAILEAIFHAETVKRKVIPMWRKIAAAAVILFAVAGTAYFMVNKKTPVLLSQVERFKNDILPGGNKAVLKLADGSIIKLDDAKNGSLAVQGGSNVIKKDGILVYERGQSVVYNDMITPATGQYQLMLADGTKVWLDALSSIHFPTSFHGGNREVEITGQAYFEVAKNPSQPFRVKVKDQVVEVLGTHFNINAYDNEKMVKTTLVEGAVKIINKGNKLVLKPGQQSQADQTGNLKLFNNPDIDETLAWKNGTFHYNGASIESIMRQIARWYGVDIVYEDQIAGQFVADIPREVPVSELLKYLEGTDHVHFKIEGKTITVMK